LESSVPTAAYSVYFVAAVLFAVKRGGAEICRGRVVSASKEPDHRHLGDVSTVPIRDIVTCQD
jgi:hypothetical protein